MTDQVHSSASVVLDRAPRFGKQVVSHLSRKYGGEWSAEGANGWIQLEHGRATITVVGEGLELAVECPAEFIERFEGVVGGHLVRFVKDPGVVVTWTRADAGDGGTEGTEQRFEVEQ